MINAEEEDPPREKILDIEAIKAAARQLSKDLSPETGDIDSVESFYNQLRAFYNTHLVKGIDLDGSSDIYKDSEDPDYELVNGEVEKTFTMTERSLSPDDIINEQELTTRTTSGDPNATYDTDIPVVTDTGAQDTGVVGPVVEGQPELIRTPAFAADDDGGDAPDGDDGAYAADIISQ